MSTLDEFPDIFQAHFYLSDANSKLNKNTYYIAVMMVDEKEIPFFLVSVAYDFLERAKAGAVVYEIMLFHHCYDAKTLPVPTDFYLYDREKYMLGHGTVTHYFADRYLIERAVKQNASDIPNQPWL